MIITAYGTGRGRRGYNSLLDERRRARSASIKSVIFLTRYLKAQLLIDRPRENHIRIFYFHPLPPLNRLVYYSRFKGPLISLELDV